MKKRCYNPLGNCRIITRVDSMNQLNGQQLKANLKSPRQWIRLVYMTLFLILLYSTIVVAGLLVFIQVLFVLISGSANGNITRATADLTRYINQILLFLTYNDDRKPFPFSPWGELEKPAVIVENTAYGKDEHEVVADIEPKKIDQ